MKNDFPDNVAVCLSGGLDSTSVLARIRAISPDINVIGICFKYGSKHNKLEREAAELIVQHYGIPLLTVDLRTLFAGYVSSMLNPAVEIPEGHYEEESMKSTVVHMRNLIFATIASSKAMEYFGTEKRIMLALGIHAGDHTIYPDCRHSTINFLGEAILQGSDTVVGMYAPFLHLDKAVIVKQGLDLDAPFHLTRTCYTDNVTACGKCGSCMERLEAFAKNEKQDPISYQDDF